MRKNNKIAICAAAAALAVTVSLAPVSVQAKTGWKSKVLLPSSGIGYALSAKKVSVRDVENKMVRTGKMDKLVKSSSTAGTDNNSSRTDNKKAIGASAVTAIKVGPSVASEEELKTAAQQYEEEVNAIIETTLTPVQEKEKAVVERAKLVKQADVVDTEEISEKEAIMAAVAAPTVTEDELNAPIYRANDKSSASVITESVQISDGVSSEGSTVSDEASAVEASGEGATGDEPLSESEQDAQTSDNTENSENDSESDSQSSEEESSAEASTSNLVVSTANDFVYIRKEPSKDSEILGKMYAQSVGTVVEEEHDGWIKMKSGNVTGYVKADYLASGNYAQKLADAVGTNKAVVTTTTLRVRAASSTESDVISLIGQGQELDIIGEENGFYKVSTPDGDGYISKDFADVETIYPDAISIEEEQAKIRAEEEKAAAAAAAAKNGKKSSSSGSSQSSTQKTAPQSAAGSSKGQQVVSYAQQFLGNPYVWGGSSLTNGADCSGFTMAVYSHFGVSLPHYDGAQRSVGTAVSSLADAQPGDLICYYGHVGIYIGNGQIIHASNPKSGIIIGNANYRQIAAIRRIFN